MYRPLRAKGISLQLFIKKHWKFQLENKAGRTQSLDKFIRNDFLRKKTYR